MNIYTEAVAKLVQEMLVLLLEKIPGGTVRVRSAGEEDLDRNIIRSSEVLVFLPESRNPTGHTRFGNWSYSVRVTHKGRYSSALKMFNAVMMSIVDDVDAERKTAAETLEEVTFESPLHLANIIQEQYEKDLNSK